MTVQKYNHFATLSIFLTYSFLNTFEFRKHQGY